METSKADFQAEEKQNCPICLGDFKIPRQLPCMHSFCETCLQDYLSSQEEKLKKLKQIECPICRHDVRILQQGTSGPNMASLFPINVILQSIVSHTKEKVDHPCDSCHSTGMSRPADGFCVECEEAMCEHCSEVHKKQKISRNHVIISMKEFTGNPHNVMKLAKGFSCPEHDGEAIDFYCKDHGTACCGKCCIVSHRSCSHVSDLKKELPSLQWEKNVDNIMDQMKMLESHLNKFMETNKSNINLLESQVNGLTAQIRELRTKLNFTLDELERRVKIEGNIIYKEQMLTNENENHRSQSLINSIRNSHKLLETVKNYGTETQVFLMTEKMTSQLTSYMDQIQEKYMKTETNTVVLEVNLQVQSLMSTGLDSLAKITTRKTAQSLPLLGIRTKTYKDCLIQRDRIIEVKDKVHSVPYYTGVINLFSGHVMLVDYDNTSVCLLDYSYNTLSSYKLEWPYNICVVDGDNEVAVTLPIRKTIQFLSVRNKKITPTRTITTRYECNGIAAAGMGKVVISGNCGNGGKHYWSLISIGWNDESFHPFDCQCGPSWTSVTLDLSLSCVYMTVNMAHSLHCFDMSGKQKFIYSHDSFKNPRGVATDKYDNVYVVACGSNNIHQLTPDGVVLQIISDGVPAYPGAICLNRDGDVFLVTARLGNSKLYQYHLKSEAVVL